MTRTLEELREYLVGEWKFDNNFLDTSGNGNHGVPTDIEWKPTARGLKPFGNDTPKIDCGELSFNFSEQNWTISAWVHIDNLSREWQVISGTGTWNERMFMGIHAGSRPYFRDSGSGLYGNAWESTGWHHVGVRKSGTTYKFIQDGKPTYSTTIETTTESNEYVMLQSSAFYSDIPIDDSKVYSTALTDDEVLALYNSTKHAYGVRPAERSFTHRLQPDVDDNTIVAFDMHTKNADGTLMDLSW